MGVAAALMVASASFACTEPEGITYFSDGKLSRSVVRGARISAFAYGATPSKSYKLVIGSDGPHPTHACMQVDFTVNNTIRRPTPEGFIGKTAGPAGSAASGVPALGTYQVCFRATDGGSATAAATITIV